MSNYNILNSLSRIHGIHIISCISEDQIYTAVYCKYWTNKFTVFNTTHKSKDFSLNEASIYFLDQVLKMSGLKITETLK